MNKWKYYNSLIINTGIECADGTEKIFDQNCTHEDTFITCEADDDNKLTAVGVYTLSEVRAVDTIEVPTDEGTKLTVEIKESVCCREISPPPTPPGEYEGWRGWGWYQSPNSPHPLNKNGVDVVITIS